MTRPSLLPPSPPPPPKGRTIIDSPLPSLSAVALLAVLVGIVIWFTPDLGTWMREHADQRVAERAYVSCEPPAELEQLHIIVTRVEGRIAASCMYVGSRGSYTRRSVRQEPAQ